MGGRGNKDGHLQVGVWEMSSESYAEWGWEALLWNWPEIGKWGLWFQRIRVCKLPCWAENCYRSFL